MDLNFVLASSSPARAQLLKNAGYSFIVDPAHLDEESFVAPTYELLVQRLSQEKARVVKARHPDAFVLAADTLILCEYDGVEQIFGKPKDPEHAAMMLQTLQGKTHQVLTGLCLIGADTHQEASDYEVTYVTFKSLSLADIDAYIATQEPFGKSGGYAIQGIARQALVEKIEGDESNVVGLPLKLLSNLLAKVGH
jgi:septum formation protein